MFGDASILSWMLISGLSNAKHIDESKLEPWKKVSNLTELIELTYKYVKPDSLVLIGFDERFVLHGDFALDEFTTQLRTFVYRLLDHHRVKQIILASIVPDPERLDNPHYKSAIHAANRAIWSMRKEKTRSPFIFILDMGTFVQKRYEADRPDLRNVV